MFSKLPGHLVTQGFDGGAASFEIPVPSVISHGHRQVCAM